MTEPIDIVKRINDYLFIINKNIQNKLNKILSYKIKNRSSLTITKKVGAIIGEK